MADARPIWRQAFNPWAVGLLLTAILIAPLLSLTHWAPMVVTLVIGNSVTLTSNVLFILLMAYQLGRLRAVNTFVAVRLGQRPYHRIVLTTLLIDWLVYTVSLYTIESLAFGWTHVDVWVVWLFFAVNALMYLVFVGLMALTLVKLPPTVAVILAFGVNFVVHYVLLNPLLPRFIAPFNLPT
ncbi:MAG TPA: hypothetical protein DCY46_02765 [Lactobacillus sp.]|jgi:hypothetical protein|uniref:hypothetical protein n=1 Tax=Schleiferilactobacillus harbinensis TaxID=304207 RepID=UPI000E8EA050|nr:hypothetical protein [Schleiferilactobacillus harbinensis]QEU48517.1 hypothetical protein FMM01_15005 [Schleiferilactobacillus harbinensis]HAY52888.1 hypothetical protein [Lactobacillus sp.]